MALHTFGATALLGALYSRLTTDSGTSSYSTYNYVPTTATFPYIALGGVIGGKSAEWTSRDIKGEDIVIHAHVWSSYQGDKECADMMSAIITAVTTTDLSITGYTTLKLIPDFEQIMIDDTNPNQLLRHGVIRFRCHMA